MIQTATYNRHQSAQRMINLPSVKLVRVVIIRTARLLIIKFVHVIVEVVVRLPMAGSAVALTICHECVRSTVSPPEAPSTFLRHTSGRSFVG